MADTNPSVWPEVAVELVRARVKAREATPEVKAAHATAEGMVRQALLDAYRPVLDTDYVECVLRVAYAIYDGSKSSDGVRQQVTVEGQTPTRAPRDPMAGAQPIVNRYVLQMS